MIRGAGRWICESLRIRSICMDERVFAGGGGSHPELPGVRDGNRGSGGHKFKEEVASWREKGREATVKSAGLRNRNCERTPREARESL